MKRSLTNDFLYQFIRQNPLAVVATVAGSLPEAALVGAVSSPDLKLIFDTDTTSRKYQNLLQNPRVAFVFGWENEQTLQYEGIAQLPDSSNKEALLPFYFDVFPEGKERAATIVHFVVEPTWVRYSDFKENVIEERRF